MRIPRIFAVAALFFWLWGMPSWAEDRPYVSALRSLSVNRSLLTRSEAEYRSLLSEEQRDGSGELSEKLSDLRYKIQALKEDQKRLRSELPAKTSADEFLQEWVDRQAAPQDTPIPVDLDAENRIEQKVRSINEMHEEALSSIAKDRYADAAKIYEEIILLSPDNDEVYLLLGHTRLALGHYEKAGEAFRNAIHIEPLNIDEIPRLYENILLENPLDDDAMAQLGFAYVFLGNATAAKDSFEAALEIDPDNRTAQEGLGILRSERYSD